MQEYILDCEKFSLESAGEMLDFWSQNGFIVLDKAYDESLLDGINRDIESACHNMWGDGELLFNGVDLGDDGVVNLLQKDLMKYSAEDRDRLLGRSNWRIHGFKDISDNAGNVAKTPIVEDIVKLILGKDAPAGYSINFFRGSEQALHQDQAVFHNYPVGTLIGCWIALEDIHPDSGPLDYYPGSHVKPLYSGFTDYPRYNLRNADPEMIEAYYNYVEATKQNYECRQFIARKGQALLWHAGLIHGGGKINNPELTRKSFVLHYMPGEYDYHNKVPGPFNW